MDKITVRNTSADIPVFEAEDDFETVTSLESASTLISPFQFGSLNTRALNVKDISLIGGKIHSVRTETASVIAAQVRSVEFKDCELASLRWQGGKITRTKFNSCKMLGARFDNVVMEHTVFIDCIIDYSVLNQVRTTGPVMFIRCSLRESEFTACNMSRGLFDKCDFTQTNFGSGNYTGCDLRNNDLSALLGTPHLRRAIIDRAQLLQLSQALAGELDLTFGDEQND